MESLLDVLLALSALTLEDELAFCCCCFFGGILIKYLVGPGGLWGARLGG